MSRILFDQPDDEVHAQFDRVVATLEAKLPEAGEHLAGRASSCWSSPPWPGERWTQIWSNNPLSVIPPGTYPLSPPGMPRCTWRPDVPASAAAAGKAGGDDDAMLGIVLTMSTREGPARART